MKIKIDLVMEMEWEEFKKASCIYCETKGSFNYDKHLDHYKEKGIFDCTLCGFGYEYEEINGNLTSLQVTKRIL